MAAPALTVPPFTPPSFNVGAAQAVFAFDFPFWSADDLVVSVGGLVLAASSYTVEGFYLQDGQAVSGGYGSGQVTLAQAVSNTTVIIDRAVAPVREAVYAAGVPLPPSALNTDLNRVIAMIQDLARLVAMGVPGGGGGGGTPTAGFLLEDGSGRLGTESGQPLAPEG